MQQQRSSPVSPLAMLFLSGEPAPELVIISGPSGSGKTRACLELLHDLRRARVHPTGLISPPVYESGQKAAIDLEAVHTAERRRLAVRWKAPVGQGYRVNSTGIFYGRWRFYPETFTWGNEVLNGITNTECLILDELGALEFHHNSGLSVGLSITDQQRFKPVFVVVRESLLALAKERWPWGMLAECRSGQVTLVKDGNQDD